MYLGGDQWYDGVRVHPDRSERKCLWCAMVTLACLVGAAAVIIFF